MATLYKRAAPRQRQVLRAVEGAVLNEADAHGRTRDRIMARSIAKRAAGTISALMPRLLASESLPASQGGSDTRVNQDHRRAEHKGSCSSCRRRAQILKRVLAGGWSQYEMAALRSLTEELSRTLWRLKREDPVRAEIHIQMLRTISRYRKGLALRKFVVL